MDDIGNRSSAISFFIKLRRPLRDQMKASGDNLPEDRRQMVAKAQRAWEATFGRIFRKRSYSDQHTRDPSLKRARRTYDDRSQNHRRPEAHLNRSYRDYRKQHNHRGRSKERKDDRQKEISSSSPNGKDPDEHRYYNYREKGHYSRYYPKKQRRINAIGFSGSRSPSCYSARSSVRSSSRSSTRSRIRTPSPASSDALKN